MDPSPAPPPSEDLALPPSEEPIGDHLLPLTAEEGPDGGLVVGGCSLAALAELVAGERRSPRADRVGKMAIPEASGGGG